MDPITGAILSGLIVEAIVGASGPVSRRFLRGKVKVAESLQQQIDQQSTRVVIAALAELRGKNVSDKSLGLVADFLNSPQGRSLSRRAAVAVLTGNTQSELRRELLEEISACLVVLHAMPIDEAKTCATTVRRIFVEVSADFVKRLESVDAGLASRLRRSAMQELAAGYAGGVADRATSLGSYSPQDVTAAFSRMLKYRQLLHDRTRELVPGNISAANPIRLDEGYVNPRFTSEQPARFMKLNQEYRQDEGITLEQIERRLHRLVVLGNPGAGKSTLAQYLTWTTSVETDGALQAVPFLIILREFEQERTSKDLKVTEYLAAWSKRELQLEVTARDVELMLMTGRGFVIFDGLDELLVSERRRAMAALIGSFSSMYPDASVLVTCRAVGYVEARLQEDVFSIVYLDDFTEAQVTQYVETWFKRAARLTAAERKSLPPLFMQQSKSAEDLRRNPLMLGLMCRVFQEWRDIPQNRTELYEDCAGLLFREWDRKRGIKTSKEVLRHDARLALQEIAYWRLTDSTLTKGIPKPLLIRRLSEIFLRDRFEDHTASRKEASDLVELWSGRAWVLSDVGNPDGEELYDFTHLTFAEYFAAAHLSRVSGTPSRLWRSMAARIKRGEWDVVAALAIQIKDRDHAGCCNQIYESAIAECGGLRADRGANVLMFLAAHIETLLPSPRLRRLLVDSAIDLAMMAHSASPTSVIPEWKKVGSAAELAKLMDARRWRELCAGIDEPGDLAVDWDDLVVGQARLQEPLRALCAGATLPDIESEYREKVLNLTATESVLAARAWRVAAWMEEEHGVLAPTPIDPLQLAESDVLVSLSLAQRGLLSLLDLLALGRLAVIYRPGSVFDGRLSQPRERRCLADELGWRLADGSFTAADSVFLHALGGRDPIAQRVPKDWAENQLMRRGCERFLQPPPWHGLTRARPPTASNFFAEPKRREALSEIDAHWCLGAFRVLACLEEIAMYSTAEEVVSPSLGFVSALAPLVFGRRVEGISMFDDPDDPIGERAEGGAEMVSDENEAGVVLDEVRGLDAFGRWLGMETFGEMYRWAVGEFHYIRVVASR